MTGWPTGATSSRPGGLAGRLVATFFFLFFLGMGLVFVWLVLREAVGGLATWTWVRTDCRIVSSAIRNGPARGSNAGNFVFDVTYQYTFRGQDFTSSRLRPGNVTFQDYTQAAHLVDRYNPQSSTFCYVNPRAPSESVLERGSLWFPFLALFPMLFVAIGAGGIYFSWRSKPSSSSPKPISDRPGFGLHPSAGYLFAVIFLLAGTALLYVFLLRPVFKIATARDWPSVPCTVVSSEVQSHHGDHGNTYSVNVLYQYDYAGSSHQANRYDFFGGSSSGYAPKRQIVDRLPPGSKTLCFVNPRDPDEAVLERGFTPTMWFGLIPLAFVLVGVAFVVKLRRSVASPVSRGFAEAMANTRSSSGTAGQNSPHPGPQVLKAQTSPAKMLVFLVIFAAFWNSIVWIGFGSMIRGSHTSPLHWFMVLFMVPFILVGVVLLGAVVYFFLALFNPRPQITINPGAVCLGNKLRIEWELRGRTDVLRSFEVRLQGREEATYRRGTNSITDRNVFADLLIASSTVAPEMQSGSGEVTIPLNSMHSFSSTNNRIIWSIRVHGEIHRWPDLQEEFPVTVLPANRPVVSDL